LPFDHTRSAARRRVLRAMGLAAISSDPGRRTFFVNTFNTPGTRSRFVANGDSG